MLTILTHSRLLMGAMFIQAAGSCRALGARTGVPGRLDTKVAAFL
jgi:hypothetical protein